MMLKYLISPFSAMTLLFVGGTVYDFHNDYKTSYPLLSLLYQPPLSISQPNTKCWSYNSPYHIVKQKNEDSSCKSISDWNHESYLPRLYIEPMFNFIIDNRNMKLKKSNSDLDRIVMLRFMFTDSYISDLPAINTHLLQTSRLKVLFGRIRNGLSRIKFNFLLIRVFHAS